MRVSRVGVLVVVGLLLVAAGAGPATAGAVGDDDRQTVAEDRQAAENTETGVDTACFGAGGHQFEIGTEGPRIYLTLHLSLVSNPLSNGSFGVELVGVALDSRIVTLAAGVRHQLPAQPADVLSNPFDGFVYVFDYRLSLPMFESTGASDYASDPPVSGPVNGTAC